MNTDTDNENTPGNITPDASGPAVAHAGGKKPTNSELETRIEYTSELVSQGLAMSAIKSKLRERFGELSARTCASYRSRACAMFLEQAGQSREEIRAESFAFYKNVISDPKATLRERLLARERIDKIFGIETLRTELSGSNGEPLVPPPTVRYYLSGGLRAPRAKNETDEEYAARHLPDGEVLPYSPKPNGNMTICGIGPI